jgi:orotidine-5'-phosphate decarboxylase
MMDVRDRLIVGLDVPGVADAEAMVERLGDQVTFYKIGLQLVFAGGLPFAEKLARAGKKIFLDVKLLDIDNTVESAVKSITAMGMTYVTVHAYPHAIRAAMRGRGDSALKLLGVSVLTSMDDADLVANGYADKVSELVLRRARDAAGIGLDGLICAPDDVPAIRAAVGGKLRLITPGIRPAGAAANDQKRIATPASAIRAGADQLVCVRPILGAPDPRKAAADIIREIEGALAPA